MLHLQRCVPRNLRRSGPSCSVTNVELKHRNLSSFSFVKESLQDFWRPLWTTLDHFSFPFTCLLLFTHVRQSEFQDSSPSSEISSPLERCLDTWQILACFKAVSASFSCFSCFGCFGSMLSMSQDQTQTFSLTSDNQGI